MWGLPRPGIEPLTPALAGGLLTTEPPEKSLIWVLTGFLWKQLRFSVEEQTEVGRPGRIPALDYCKNPNKKYW